MSHVRRVGRNFGLLLGGQATGAVLGLATLALMARRLDPAALGVVVLLHTYVVSVRELFSFKPFEAIVRYGVPRLDAGDFDSVKRLLRFALRLDVLSSVGATVIAAAVAPFLGTTLGWQSEHTVRAVALSACLLLSWIGTAKGVLRLCGRFDALSACTVVAALVRLIGAAIAYVMDAGIPGFTAAWGASMLAEYLYTNLRAWREIRRRIPDILTAAPSALATRDEFPGIWAFVNIVYWQSNFDLLPKHLATLLAGVLLGPAGAGMFRIAREFSAALAKPAVLLRQAVFPDLTRLWHQRDRAFKDLCIRLGLMVGIPALGLVALVIVFGAPLIDAALGADYVAIVPLLTLLLFAASLDLMSGTLRPAAYAANKASEMLWIQMASTVVYMGLFLALTPRLGLAGPGYAACLASILAIAGMSSVILKAMKSLDGAAP